MSSPCLSTPAAASSANGACQEQSGGWGPLRPGKAPRTPTRKPGPAERRDWRNKEPGEQVSRGAVQQDGLRLRGRLALSGEGRCGGEEGTPKPAPVGAAEPAASAVVCIGAGRGLGAGPPVPGEKLLLSLRSRLHGAAVVTAPPPRTPGRRPLLPPSPTSWACPWVSSLELW